MYQSRTKYSGFWNENLRASLDLYDTLTRMCGMDDNEKAHSLPVMLQGDALSHYSNTYKPEDDYAVIVKKMADRFTSAEQKGRLLRLWQSLRLTEALKEDTDQSEVEVFRAFSYKLSTLQKQLESHYQHDDFIRDQLIVSTDLPRIQQSLLERVPSSSQDAVNRIATFLSHKKGSSNSVFISSEEPDSAMYSLGNRYGGDARRNTRPSYGKRNNYRRFSSSLLKGIKGCYVCGRDHNARSRHTQEEVKAAVEKLKKKHPTAMLSVEDLAFITNELTCDVDENPAPEDGDQNIFSDSDEDSNVVYVAEDTLNLNKSNEVMLANNSFLHGRTHMRDKKRQMDRMRSELTDGECTKFRGLLIDTCANRSSIMSIAQYKAYCDEF